jgi:tripartite-type tricarboxylate transporter receptor subunit TctC
MDIHGVRLRTGGIGAACPGPLGLPPAVGWSGLWGPKGLPKEVTDKWVAALAKLSKDKAWNKLTKGLGSIPSIMKPEPTKAFVKNQYLKFKDVAERLNLVIK